MKDDRQTNHIQTYKSEVLTLARTAISNPLPPNYCYSANARIKVIKSDFRLPLTVFVAFDPDGGNPDRAIITSSTVPDINGQIPGLKANVSELILARRSYVPILKAVGSILDLGKVDVPSRPGALGFAWRVSDECDAVDISVQLPHAVGEQIGVNEYGDPTYWYGRWVTGYSFTTNERLSREEWALAAAGTNMSIEYHCEPNYANGIPVIVKVFGA